MIPSDLPALLDSLARLDALAELSWKVYRDAVGGCTHPRTKLIVIPCVNGASQYRNECQDCGSVSDPIAHRKIPAGLKERAGWRDEGIRQGWYEKHQTMKRRAVGYREAAREIRQEEGFYRAYLDSPEWASRRIDVLRRAGDWCELCRSEPAQQVHHLNYTRLGNESLEDLQALCVACHVEQHKARKAC